jgi:hypothetical protein
MLGSIRKQLVWRPTGQPDKWTSAAAGGGLVTGPGGVRDATRHVRAAPGCRFGSLYAHVGFCM